MPWRIEGDHGDRFHDLVLDCLVRRYGENGPMTDPGSSDGMGAVSGLMLDAAIRGL